MKGLAGYANGGLKNLEGTGSMGSILPEYLIDRLWNGRLADKGVHGVDEAGDGDLQSRHLTRSSVLIAVRWPEAPPVHNEWVPPLADRRTGGASFGRS